MAASSPEEVHELFTRYFSAGDLEALMSLYEPGATMLPRPGPAVTGAAGIRDVMTGFFSLKPQLDLKLKKAVHAGDIALLFSVWTLKGTDPAGGAVEMAGVTSDVVRRQPDGTWLFVIDIPNGAEAAND
ncbi:MAG: ketosteroid isomerase-like enzyme [Acidobacteria bacterium]|nr:ketosteroid isomerase-like enzyme [Acidobacteriota bacterium]